MGSSESQDQNCKLITDGYINHVLDWKVSCIVSARSYGPLLTSKRHAVSVTLYYFQMARGHRL